MPPRKNTTVRQAILLELIKTQQPKREELLQRPEYSVASPRTLDRDIEEIRAEHEIIHDSDGRYALAESVITKAILESILTTKERELLKKLQQEFLPQHPYGVDLQLILDRLAGQIGKQQEKIKHSAPHSYLGTRFTRDYTLYRPLLENIETAINQRERISFVYNHPVSREIERVPHYEVEPQFLELRYGTFYLYGYNLYRKHGYHFRIDKLQHLKFLGEKFHSFRNPEAEMLDFEYILQPRIVKGGISERFYRQEVIAYLPDGSAHLRGRDFEFWILQEFLRMGNTARLVAAPDSLLTRYRQEVTDMFNNINPSDEKI